MCWSLVCVSEFYGEGITLGRNMGPGQGGSRSECVWEEGNNKGGHWAQAREGPRTISPKRGKNHSYKFDFYHV